MLLRLPPELLRQIIFLLDPESFSVCLLTCRAFRNHALNSTKLLRVQLKRMPGRQDQIESLNYSAESLLTIFSTRAAQHMHNGGVSLADVHSFRPSTRVDWKNSTIISCPCKWTKHLMLAEVCSDDALVRLHTIAKHGRRDYRPKLKHVISPNTSCFTHTPFSHQVRFEVVKIAVCESEKPFRNSPWSCINKIAVLYRYRPTDDVSPQGSKAAEESQKVMKLVIYKLDPEFGPFVVDALDVHIAEGHYPVAIAVSKSGTPVVVFRWHEGRSHRSKLVRYDRSSTSQDSTPVPIASTLEEDSRYPDEVISGIEVKGKRVHLFPPWLPIPQWTISNLFSHLEISRRNNHLPDDIEAFASHSLGKAFASHHHHLITDPSLNHGMTTCINTALEVMISREEFRYGVPGRVGAFILKAVHYPDKCEMLDLNSDYRNLYHVFVARLAGLGSLFNLSTLGIRMAVSPCGQRIAMASWKRVLVWALDPKAFLDPATLADGSVPGDHAYLEGCGYQYYQCNKFYKEMVELQPAQLPEVGVVFDLAFREEDELWAWTEKGLVRWRFGVWSNRRRDITILE